MDLGVPNYQAGPEAVRAKHQSWSIFGCYCCDQGNWNFDWLSHPGFRTRLGGLIRKSSKSSPSD
jgi:hypothetical protein